MTKAPRSTPQARRQAILEAAMEVFARQGVGVATTDDIARAAGLSKGGLYWHFKSKDEILAAILHMLFDQELQVLQNVLRAEVSAASRIRSLAAQAAEAVVQFEQLLPMVLEFYALAARDGAVRQFLQLYYQRYHQLLTELFQQGFAAGEFKNGTSESAAAVLIGQLEGLALMWAIAPEIVHLPEQTAAAAELFLAGLMAPPERS